MFRLALVARIKRYVVSFSRPFRFEKGDLERLRSALVIPEVYRCETGTKASGMEALLIMLHRLSYLNSWCDLAPLFGRAEPELSAIFNMIIDNVYINASNVCSRH